MRLTLSYVFRVDNVVFTASSWETVDWAKKNGATHKTSHREPLILQLETLASLAFICYDTANNVEQLIPVRRPRRRIDSLVEAADSLGIDGGAAFGKALSFHWSVHFPKSRFHCIVLVQISQFQSYRQPYRELMFARPLRPSDQGEIINNITNAV